MKQRFFIDSIESSFIKNLLHSTPLPIFNTIVVGDYIFKDKLYIYKRQIIKCTKSGYFMTDKNKALYDVVGTYSFGKDITQITEQFNSKYAYYDTETHEWLGKYLRCYRDIYDINLMPFYNCYSGRYLSGYKIKDDAIYEDINGNAYKIYQVPIKFNTTYTIAIDSEYAVHYCPAFLKKNSFIQLKLHSEKFDLTERFLLAYPEEIKKQHSTSFLKPFTYKLDITDIDTSDINDAKIENYENDLYLLIQVASGNESSLVVLEGDYTNVTDRRSMPWVDDVTVTDADKKTVWINTLSKKFNPEEINQLSDQRLNELMLSKLSLLQFNDKVRYPFADRLIEYLLLNVIDSNEDIPNNVLRVQQSTELLDNSLQSPDVWDNILREYVYSKSSTNPRTRYLDLNGFVDKDVEKAIGGN